jgi:hypothetical protein
MSLSAYPYTLPPNPLPPQFSNPQGNINEGKTRKFAIKNSSLLPPEILQLIIDLINPGKYTKPEISQCIKILKQFKLNSVVKEKIQDLRKITTLVKKYSVYNKIYEDPQKAYLYISPKYRDRILNGGNPQLVDALSSGIPFFYNLRRSMEWYSSKVEQDIKDIVRITPQSLNCLYGGLHSVTYAPPLLIACVNPAIPEHMIEFLLKNGADPNTTIVAGSMRMYILTALKKAKGSFNEDRYEKIEKIFLQNGLNPQWESQEFPLAFGDY